MLKELSIRNFAIIDDLRIHFSPGFTILSGETGAGKSILINAVNLLLGSRASATLIRTGCDAAELEALFNLSPETKTAMILAEHGYPVDEDLLIRRTISRSGSNRIYIGGRLATMQLLGAVTENLASISGQHAHQSLLKEDQHLMILDQFADLLSLRQKHIDNFRLVSVQMDRVHRLKALKDRQFEQNDLWQFQKMEIESAAISEEEEANLEQERIRLKNSEYLFQSVYQAVDELYSRQGSVTEQVDVVRRNLDRAARVDSDLASRVKQLSEINFQLEDLADALRAYLKTVQLDESRLEWVEERLDLINKLKRKYGGSIKSTIDHLATISQKLSELGNLDEEISKAEQELSASQSQLIDLSTRLSKKRKAAAKELAKKVEIELDNLNMPQTQFKVAMQCLPADEQTDRCLQASGMQVFETGVDRVSFLIAPNIGEELKALTAIASGGELSRIVLALKAILAASETVETIIFDEVDAGIGGGTAEVVGSKLSDLARRHQVLCITHLPQIAKFGAHHFRISKQVLDGRTLTMIEPLDDDDRIVEIARMLGGVDITATTLHHARELLKP
jgi:DNA repair protein RecN (Recombination protein N)